MLPRMLLINISMVPVDEMIAKGTWSVIVIWLVLFVMLKGRHSNSNNKSDMKVTVKVPKSAQKAVERWRER